MHKNFMYYITNFWALVLVNVAAREVFGNLMQLHLVTRPASINTLAVKIQGDARNVIPLCA
jgi:hypothetical protein